jgi:hypothetical protein
MFDKKIIRVYYLTRDEQGRVELWESKPVFVHAEDGNGFFVDVRNPENQLSLDDPFNRVLSHRVLVLNSTCQTVIVNMTKKGSTILLGETFSYKESKELCKI